jgi:predicted DNA-binding antitoxin AbrB/MazE fold protein
MSQTIAARYENRGFLPLEHVVLPDNSYIRLVIPDAPIQKPRKQLKGMLAGLGITVTEDDICELRSEMWKNFPRVCEQIDRL